MFRVVRLSGHKVGKARDNVSDMNVGAGVFLYRDSSIVPLLGMRRRFKAVMGVLDAMIRCGISLARSVELTAQWDRILAAGLSLMMTLVRFGVWKKVNFIVSYLIFIIVLVILKVKHVSLFCCGPVTSAVGAWTRGVAPRGRASQVRGVVQQRRDRGQGVSGSIFGGSEPGVSTTSTGSAFRAAKAPFSSQRATPHAAGFQVSKSQERPLGADQFVNAVAQPLLDADV